MLYNRDAWSFFFYICYGKNANRKKSAIRKLIKYGFVSKEDNNYCISLMKGVRCLIGRLTIIKRTNNSVEVLPTALTRISRFSDLLAWKISWYVSSVLIESNSESLDITNGLYIPSACSYQFKNSYYSEDPTYSQYYITLTGPGFILSTCERKE